VSSANIEALRPSINKTFKDIRSHIFDIELERHTTQRDRIIKAICDYVTQTITAESKSLLSSFYSNMMDQTLGNEPFLTARNKNKFYDKDIRRMIFDRYDVSVSENINYTQTSEKFKALPIPAGMATLGVVLSIALSKVVILPISLIIAGGLYYFISEYEKDKNQKEFMAAIDRYINSVKGELIIWFEHIEAFYHEQVEELKQSIEGGHNE
jgi:hypothetical protein